MPTTNPWDPAPLPERGDEKPQSLFIEIGRALTEWERYEERLMWIYSALVSKNTRDTSLPAVMAYGTILTYRGRSEMVDSAAEGYLVENSKSEAVPEIRRILKLANKYSPRRNEIAHGIVRRYFSPEDEADMQVNLESTAEPRGFVLAPASYSTNKHDLASVPYDEADSVVYRKARYVYTSDVIRDYRNEFFGLFRLTSTAFYRLTEELRLKP